MNDVKQKAVESPVLASVVELSVRSWKLMLAVSTVAFALGFALTYAIRPVYRAETVLLPADTTSELSSLSAGIAGFGELASLAGIVPRQTTSAEGLATLNSSGFLRRFLVGHELADVVNGTRPLRLDWIGVSSKERSNNLSDAVGRFQRRIMSISQDHRTGVIRLQVYWHDPEAAAAWANGLAAQVNRELRQQALDESKRRLRYLQARAEDNNLAPVREAIYAVMEAEIKSATIASAREEFAFRIVDRAYPSEVNDYVAPRRWAIALTFVLFGVLLTALIAYASHIRQLH
jgi:uncharacterized protein involved in exopolysaccharide biosynthesis